MRDEQQVYGLMREYVEQGCSAKRHGMHRRTLKGIFSKWKGRTGIEKRIDMEGSAWHWVRAGREGGSKWTGRPTNVGRPEWKEMVWVAKQAQVERRKVDGQRKRDEAKERELQKTKMREDKIRSSNSKRKPVLHSANYVNTDNRGGVFDQRWRDSKGCLVKTEKKVGRGMQWLESMPRVTTMIDVKLWRVDKAMIRKAVYGGMLKWMEDDTEVISTEDALSWHDDAEVFRQPRSGPEDGVVPAAAVTGSGRARTRSEPERTRRRPAIGTSSDTPCLGARRAPTRAVVGKDVAPTTRRTGQLQRRSERSRWPTKGEG